VDDLGSISGSGNDGIFSPHHRVQIDSETHPASYPMRNMDHYPGDKAAGT